MNMQGKGFILTVVVAGLMLPAAAQTSSAPVTRPATIDQRQQNQQERIANGVENGQLTAGEAGRLEHKEAALNREEQRMKADGKFTPAERARIQHQQNRLSRNVYRQKHDAQVRNTNPKSEVGRRQDNQQDRIAQGISSGQLTAGEAARLEHRETAIHQEVHNERVANGGRLTPTERRQVNRQENRTSRSIYRKKHNGREQ